MDELVDPRTGIYVDERTTERVALAFHGEKVRELGRASMCISAEAMYYWERGIWSTPN
jgi:hypothetical protein